MESPKKSPKNAVAVKNGPDGEAVSSEEEGDSDSDSDEEEDSEEDDSSAEEEELKKKPPTTTAKNTAKDPVGTTKRKDAEVVEKIESAGKMGVIVFFCVFFNSRFIILIFQFKLFVQWDCGL